MNENKTNRSRQGKAAGLIGLITNLLLAAAKIGAGLFFHSVSVATDGWNNFSDAAASAITLIGFHFSEKPADQDHPYGHARFEYLSALSVSVLILVIGVETAKSTLEKILSPQPVSFAPLLFGVLILSTLVKLGLMFYYRVWGRKISSPVLLAAAADSRNDVIATVSVLCATVTEHFTNLKIDGFVGVLLSAFILYSGIKMAKQTVSPLLGERGDDNLNRLLLERIRSHSIVLGCHDLMIHDYGPEKRYASVHVETKHDLDPLECHEALDRIERECLEESGVHLVIHHDPVLTDDPETERIKRILNTFLKMKDERIRIHDVRRKEEGGVKKLTFDMALPAELHSEKDKICASLEKALCDLEGNAYHLTITVDLL